MIKQLTFIPVKKDLCSQTFATLGKVAQNKIRKKSGLLPNRGVSEGSKMPNLYFEKDKPF